MTVPSESNRDLIILEQIEHNPDATQASLAAQLGVAVGTVNWHLKRLVDKGYVKVRRVERRKLRYIITPEGIALRTRLAIDYIQNSFHLYRLVRTRMLTIISEVKQAGFHTISIEGDGDVADVCRLTCLEQGISVTDAPCFPLVRIRDLKLFIEWEEHN